MMNKNVTIFVIVLVILSGDFFLKTLISSSSYGDIYNNDERIGSVDDSYFYQNRIGKSEDKRTKLSFRLTGMETLWVIKSDYKTNITIEHSF